MRIAFYGTYGVGEPFSAAEAPYVLYCATKADKYHGRDIIVWLDAVYLDTGYVKRLDGWHGVRLPEWKQLCETPIALAGDLFIDVGL